MATIDAKNWISMKPISSEMRKDAESSFFDAHVSMVAQPRRLLSSLRDIMAGSGPAIEKLDQIISLIATELRADACSCYVMRAGEALELFSTIGLNEGSVHKTRLNVGEGVVGDVAAHACPLALSDAKSYPNFAPRPETGEDEFKSICGVPVLRGQRVRGVLVIQNRKFRHYDEDTIEILQTIAMVLAELIMSGEIISRKELQVSRKHMGASPAHMEGVSLGKGVAIGRAVLYEPSLSIKEIVVDNPQAEKKLFRKALVSMQKAIDKLLNDTKALKGNEPRDILEAYKMFSKDKGWIGRINHTIEQGLSAEAAVQRVLNEMRARMAQVQDSYIQERLHDLEDLSNRLLTHLMRQGEDIDNDNLPKNIILVGRSLGPAALLDYDYKRLKAVLLEGGSASSHVAIVARALGIPVIGQCQDLTSYVAQNDKIIVDGDNGIAYIRPSDTVSELYNQNITAKRHRKKTHRRMRDKPAITKDGISISLQMNAGLPAEMPSLKESGADGIGLFRTELIFMGWSRYPRVATQAEFYKNIMDDAGDKPVTFRTLDIGGDKPLPYFDAPEEENPALGWRAIRIGLDRPAVLRTQFRALIKGAEGRPLKIMIPFVTEVMELQRARELLQMEVKRAKSRNDVLPEKIEMGVMIEVPALVWQMETLLKYVDFVSVGTNDLMQYLFAADRCSDVLKDRYDFLAPSMISVLSEIAEKCNKAHIPVSVCGEMASDPIGSMVLVSLGFNTLSMSYQSIGNIKNTIISLEAFPLRTYIKRVMSRSFDHSLRGKLEAYARDHGIVTEE